MSEIDERQKLRGTGDDIDQGTVEQDLPEDTGEATSNRNPAKSITLGVILLLVVLVVLYALSDRMAPASSRGIVAAHVVQIAPRVSGEVTEVMVADDAVVKAGDPLFSIDNRPFELAVKQAEAQLATAGQGINVSTASLVSAQASVSQARTQLDTARTDADRIFQLEKRGIVAKSQGDTARAQVANAQAQLSSARAGLKSARAQLGPSGADNPRMTFIDADAAWVSVDLRENQLQDVKPGDPVHLLFDAVPGTIFEGRVQSIAWGINPGQSAQGGLVTNQASNRWFEPARRIPVRIELAGGMKDWPTNVRVGGKVHAVVFADGTSNLIALIARARQRVRSWTSCLH